MLLDKGSRLLMIGDSITDCGRGRLQKNDQDLGDGYVDIIAKRLRKNPEGQISILNSGISGHRIADLKLRWERDVLAWKPDHLFIFIGINDVWRHFDASCTVRQISREEYAAVYKELIRTSRQRLSLKSLGLVSPYYLEPDRLNPMRRMMDEYRREVKRLSMAYGTLYADVQEAFDDFMQKYGWKCISDDRIHVNRRGHECIAECILGAAGIE